MAQVTNEEHIARLLFHDQMVGSHDGRLTPLAFPMDELLCKKGKNGSSVDRCDLLEGDRDAVLLEKAKRIANPEKNRSTYGYCFARAGGIRAIPDADNSSQALEIIPDPLPASCSNSPWGKAHALLRKFDDNYTKANLRGVRGELIELFEKRIVMF